MTKEDKELLLKDLCARLPYGVKVQPCGSAFPHKFIGYDKGLARIDTDQRYELDDIKPYLRPMSSMTEKEKNEFIRFTSISMHRFRCEATDTEHWFNTWEEEDYLDAHHFDYRRLIPMGLALPAPEGMYNV